jgi:cytochrome oxidase Cu insertion factor (SCO1/SenC/PrrC family)
MRPRALVVARAAALLVVLATTAGAEPPGARSTPPDEDRLLNVALPDITLTTAAGARVALSAVARGQPLLLTFVFTRCAGVCSPFLRSWRAADRSVSRPSAFHRIVLSFDPRDSAADMAALAHHLDAVSDAGWTFAVAAPDDVQRLAEAAGFWYDWDDERQQFDHPAMLAGIRDGRLVRLLVGGMVSSGRLDELVREVSGEFVPSYPLPGRVRFRCVQYNAASGQVALDWGFALLLVPVGATGLTTVVMFVTGARIRRAAGTRSAFSMPSSAS